VSELQLPWLELAVLTSLVGAALVSSCRDSERAQQRSVLFKCLILLWTVGAWIDFLLLGATEAQFRMVLAGDFPGADLFLIDRLSAPLLPLASILYLATAVATMRTKARRFSFSASLFSEAILLTTLSCRSPWLLVALLAASTIPPLLELKSRGRPVRVFVLHMGVSIALMVAGQALLSLQNVSSASALVGVSLLTAGLLIRCGVFPLHVWIGDLFEHATFGTALLFVTPMVGAYAALRLVLPIAPEWMLRGIGLLSLFTAVYAAGMTLVQREARRFFCYLFLSHSSLVLVGLETGTPIALTGGLSVWLSASLSLAGLGLTLRSMEARLGRLSLACYHGLYEHTPMLAAFFLLTGLASVGFPGTFGFVGTELLVEGVVQVYPYVGTAVFLAAALNGIAVLQAFFRVFTGGRHAASISLRSRTAERLAVLALTALILIGGLFPQPGILSRHRAATQLVEARQQIQPVSVPSRVARHAAAAKDRRQQQLPVQAEVKAIYRN
jgi:NADH-quinone oxidoreductase subunit M